MAENETVQKSGGVGKLLAGLVIVALAAYGVYSIYGGKSNEQAGQKHAQGQQTTGGKLTRAFSKGDMTAFLVHAKRKPVADLVFHDSQGKTRNIKDWRGKVVLVNLWATWCGPCRKEMPELAELQEKFGGDDFEVVAISVDRKGIEASGRFLAEAKATALNLYVDKTTKVLKQLKAVGLPVTVLVDRQGNEAGRLVGPAKWASPDAIRLIKAALAEK